MTIALFVLLLVFFLTYVLTPVFSSTYRKMQMPADSSAEGDLNLRKQEVLVALSDLEYDFQMQKMNDADYLQVKEKLLKEGAILLQQLESVNTPQAKQKPIRQRATA